MLRRSFFNPLLQQNSGAVPSVVDIYFIAIWGQSNGTSRFTISGNLPAGQQGAQTGMYNWAYNAGTPAWQSYNSGTNDSYGTNVVINGSTTDYNNVAGCFAIGNSLGYKLYNTYNKPTYLVSSCVGGTGLDSSFTPLTWDSGTVNNLYDQALNRTLSAYAACKAANPGLTIKPVILWVQGESDAYTSQATADNYETNLTNLINTSRTELEVGDADFANVDYVVTSLRADTVSYPWRDTVQRAQVAVASTLDNVYLHYMNTDRTPISSDTEHYTPISASFGGQLAAVNAGYDLADAFNQLYEPIVDTGYIQYLGVNTSTSGDYKYVDFTTHGILKVLSTGSKTLDNYLVLGGGGSGGNGVGTQGGGGGGGEAKIGTSLTVSAVSYPVYIGAGGAIAGGTFIGKNGSSSTAFSQTASGGSGGASYDAGGDGLSGVNGGGGSSYKFGAKGLGGTGTGFNGGDGFLYSGGQGAAGGGAGANGNGANATSTTVAGAGGVGIQWVDGTYYGGGGGGSCDNAGTPGAGGNGGGGVGHKRSVSAAVSGTDGLGGGGGGLSDSALGQTTGGSGRVKLRIKFQN